MKIFFVLASFFLIQNVFASTSTVPISTSTPIVASTELIVSNLVWNEIKINEIMPNPLSGDEWVEIFNPTTSSLDLNGGSICDSTNKGCKFVSGTIMSKSWFVVDLKSKRYLYV